MDVKLAKNAETCRGRSVVWIAAHQPQDFGNNDDLLVNKLTPSHSDVMMLARSHLAGNFIFGSEQNIIWVQLR
jgi:hypothetical protein